MLADNSFLGAKSKGTNERKLPEYKVMVMASPAHGFQKPVPGEQPEKTAFANASVDSGSVDVQLQSLSNAKLTGFIRW